jgi:hypothetical protein
MSFTNLKTTQGAWVWGEKFKNSLLAMLKLGCLLDIQVGIFCWEFLIWIQSLEEYLDLEIKNLAISYDGGGDI